MTSPVLYLLAAMIFYDLAIHVTYLLGFEGFFLKRKLNYWPELKGRRYQLFWSAYWGVAFALLLAYLIRK